MARNFPSGLIGQCADWPAVLDSRADIAIAHFPDLYLAGLETERDGCAVGAEADCAEPERSWAQASGLPSRQDQKLTAPSPARPSSKSPRG